jgi:hypothetical protein
MSGVALTVKVTGMFWGLFVAPAPTSETEAV